MTFTLRAMEVDRSKMTLALLALLSVIAFVTAVYHMQAVLIPLLIAWLMAQMLGPLVVFFVRHRVPNALAITLVMVMLVLGIYYIGVFITASANQFIGKIPEFQPKFVQITNDILNALSPHLEGADVNVINTVRAEIANLFGSMVTILTNLVGFLTTSLFKMVMILIMVAFMLVGKPYGDAKIKRALSTEMAGRVQRIVDSISINLSQYLFLQFVISAVTGLLIWFACQLLGVQSAITWGALGFFLNFIPTIGSIVACIPPILLALLQHYPDYWPALILAIALIAIQQIMGNIVSPKMMGDRLNLSPVVILLSLLFWGWLWGITGALLSVVIVSALKIVCDNIEPLRPVGIMMEAGKVSAKRLRQEMVQKEQE